MKIISILLATLISASSISLPIEHTEDAQLLESLDREIEAFKQSNQQPPKENSTSKAAPKPPTSKITTEAEARSFIKFAGAAYCAKEKLLNWSCSNCNGPAANTSEVVYFSNTDLETAGYLGVNHGKKLIIVGYRGTTNIDNWLGNINTSFTSANLPSPNQNAKIHSGFNDMTNGLLSQSKAAIASAIKKYPGYKIVFTGHSLGGALATVTAFKLVQGGVLTWDKVNILTYGQPRVGNPDFASYINSKSLTVTRVTSYADLVAISPGRTAGYEHNQYNMHINKNGQTIQCSIYEEDPKCISDHLIPNREAHFTFWDQRMNTKC